MYLAAFVEAEEGGCLEALQEAASMTEVRGYLTERKMKAARLSGLESILSQMQSALPSANRREPEAGRGCTHSQSLLCQ